MTGENMYKFKGTPYFQIQCTTAVVLCVHIQQNNTHLNIRQLYILIPNIILRKSHLYCSDVKTEVLIKVTWCGIPLPSCFGDAVFNGKSIINPGHIYFWVCNFGKVLCPATAALNIAACCVYLEDCYFGSSLLFALELQDPQVVKGTVNFVSSFHFIFLCKCCFIVFC